MTKPETSAREAGRLGGLATLKKYGREHYSQMGQKGAAATIASHGREHYSKIARRPRPRERRPAD